ncbi:hypothetical protein PAMA_007049 [Pampus argenteus]
MSVLLRTIKQSYAEAASVLERANVHTDSEIQSLTREDLHELFPGPQKLKLRKAIYEIIHTQKPIDVLLEELKEFIPRESFRAALTSNGVLVDYLHILKEMKTQMNYVQTFLDAHIRLLEENQHQEPDKGSLADTCTSASGSSGPVQSSWFGGQTEGPPPAGRGYFTDTHTSSGTSQMKPNTAQTNPPRAQAVVMYKVVVSGKPLDAHTQLLDKVKAQVWDRVQLIESEEDHQIIIVFCPISSRIGSDVDAAMLDVARDKPVILVLMHYLREPKEIRPTKTWSGDLNIVLHVNVFFHETMQGLLRCDQNNDAASMIQKKLLEYSVQGKKDASRNALGDCGDGDTTATSTRAGGAIGNSTEYTIFKYFGLKK